MKNILITGASQGIGRELANDYAKLGNNLVLLARNIEELESLKAKYQGLAEIYPFACDVSNYENCIEAVNYAKTQFGNIDLAILNAGISGSESFRHLNSKNFKRIHEVNVFGVVHFLELLIPDMIAKQSGTIVGISSLADSRGMVGSAAYSSSKVALSHILESARGELSKHNVKIITVRPGFIKTNMTSKNKFPMPFLIDVSKASEIIRRGIESSKSKINFPLPMSILSTIGKILPSFIYDGLSAKVKVMDK